MPHAPAALEPDALNAATDERAVDLLRPLIERSSLVAARVAAHRPFHEPEALVEAIRAEIDALDRAERLGLLRDHPELALDDVESMTLASRREQSRLGLDAPAAAERARLRELNRRYRERFGFPFVVALHGHDRLASVLECFEARLEAEPEGEIETALGEVVSVSRARVLAAWRAREARPA